MLERGVEVDHTTLFRWIQHYAPEIEKRLRWYYKPGTSSSWQVDETYVKIKEKWCYLYRAIDFYLSRTRNAKAAKRVLGKALRSLKPWAHPRTINTDKAAAYISAISELANEGKCPPDLFHRSVKYLNSRIESDHGKLKRLIKPTLGFKTMKTASATIKGCEVMLMFKKGQFNTWVPENNVMGEIRLINRQFNIYTA